MKPGTHKTQPIIHARSGKTASLASMRGRRGFTLIEIMITVAIVGILAAIAYPSYVDQVRKSRRGQLKADLVELAQFLERRFTSTNSYDQGPGGVDVADIPVAFTTSPRSSAGTAVAYNITLTAIAASSFTLSAARANAQAGDPCGTFTLNQAGGKTAAMANCW